jgi:hypothetical protein
MISYSLPELFWNIPVRLREDAGIPISVLGREFERARLTAGWVDAEKRTTIASEEAA